jgi:hypothetical protein
MTFDIVIPAYDEEQSIETTIERCLAARSTIISQTPVESVTITVVSDGSRDRTEELARAFEPHITVIAYPDNRGYGTAIKAGFAAHSGELVGFLDADGTCDPEFFSSMIARLVQARADVALGSRMGPDSSMPRIRRFGNTIWRVIINWLAQTQITDAASGMRVMRRDALPTLAPLPDGLHYTPTMSCRAALDADLQMVEVPMSYSEREGRSKLSVVRDGTRFLLTIVDVGLTYQPFRILALPGIFLLALAFVLGLPVVLEYIEARQIAPGDIYRMLTVLTLAACGMQTFLTGLVAERAVDIIHRRQWSGGRLLQWLKRLVAEPTLLTLGVLCICMAVALNAHGLWTWVTEGFVYQHWSRAATGAMLVLLGFQFLGAAVLDRILGLLALRVMAVGDELRARKATNGAPDTTPDAEGAHEPD